MHTHIVPAPRSQVDRILSSLDFMRVCGVGNDSALKSVRGLVTG
jgi:hypothetical protein